MVFRLLACVTLSLAITWSATAIAAESPNPNSDPAGVTEPTAAAKADKRVFGGFPRNIFAFPGKECPPASRVYPGPEQKDLEKTNAIYCVFRYRYVWFFKTPNLDRCPDGKEPALITERPKDSYTSGRNTTEILWCDMPTARFLGNGMLAPQVGKIDPVKPTGISGPPKPAEFKPKDVPKEPPDLLKGTKNIPPPGTFNGASPGSEKDSANTSQPPVTSNMPVGTPVGTSAPETSGTAASGGVMNKIFDFFRGKKSSDTPPATDGN